MKRQLAMMAASIGFLGIVAGSVQADVKTYTTNDNVSGQGVNFDTSTFTSSTYGFIRYNERYSSIPSSHWEFTPGTSENSPAGSPPSSGCCQVQTNFGSGAKAGAGLQFTAKITYTALNYTPASQTVMSGSWVTKVDGGYTVMKNANFSTFSTAYVSANEYRTTAEGVTIARAATPGL